MAYVDIDIEDHLDEVDTRVLISELKSRKLSEAETKEIDKWANDDDMKEVMELLKITSLSDIMKFEAFINCFRDIPEAELDEFLNKYKL